MMVSLPLWVEAATADHLVWLAEQLSKNRNEGVSKAGAVDWLARKHMKKVRKIKPEKQALIV